MPITRTKITDDQLYTLTFALRIAAEQYDRDAATMRQGITPGAPGPTAYERMGESFDKQAADVRKLADLLDSVEFIELGPEVPTE